METNWKGRKGVHVIPNPCIRRTERAASLDRPRAVAVGRLVPVKGFDLLIRAWEKVGCRPSRMETGDMGGRSGKGTP